MIHHEEKYIKRKKNKKKILLYKLYKLYKHMNMTYK